MSRHIHTSSTVPTAVFSTAFREQSMRTDQSINQSVDQSIDQSFHQSVDQSFSQSIDDHSLRSLHIADDPDLSNNQSIDSTVNIQQPTFHEDIAPVNQSVRQSIDQSVDQTISAYPDLAPKSPNRPDEADQSVNQSINQSINQSAKPAPKASPVKALERDYRSSTLPASLNKSINQSNTHSINQSVNQSNNQPITRSPYKQNRAKKRSIFDASCTSDTALNPPDSDQSINQSINQSVNQSVHPADNLSIECRRAWTEARSVVFKDLPRLVKRMNVVDDKVRAVVWGRIANNQSTDQSIDSINQSASDKSSTQPISQSINQSNNQSSVVIESELAEISTFDALTNVVLAVARRLESESDADRISRAFRTLGLSLTANSDLESVLSDLFLNVIGEDSLTFAVFRGCHQSILFPAVFALKTSVYTAVGDLKDVRRHDGWTIEIFIGAGRVQITHTRVEQSLHAPDSAEHFEVTWNMSLNFDRHMRNLTAAFLRIQDLHCQEQMSKQRKAFIEEHLKGCGYIV